MSKRTSNTLSEGPQWLSAGIVPVRLENKPGKKPEALFLILRVFKYWDFPKGLVEKKEEPLLAALRELAEETGITEAKLSWGEDFIETEPYRGGKIARYYVAEVFTDKVVFGINPGLGHAEHHEFRWATESEASKLLGPRVLNVLQWAANKIHGS